MSDNTAASLSISIKELPSVHVAYIAYRLKGSQANLARYMNVFNECKPGQGARLRSFSQLNVGALRSVDGRPSSYDCCVQVPEVQSGSAI